MDVMPILLTGFVYRHDLNANPQLFEEIGANLPREGELARVGGCQITQNIVEHVGIVGWRPVGSPFYWMGGSVLHYFLAMHRIAPTDVWCFWGIGVCFYPFTPLLVTPSMKYF
jgi:hypothetical protein